MRGARMLKLGMITLMCLPAAVGCQRGAAALAPVTGKVAYKGYALQGGTIVFTRDSTRGENGPLAFGKINHDGTYQLYTADVPGAPAGWYRVTVMSLAAPGTLFNSYSSLPDKYRDPQSSELACEVKAYKPNSIDFNLD
jgi:hypothetical protein